MIQNISPKYYTDDAVRYNNILLTLSGRTTIYNYYRMMIWCEAFISPAEFCCGSPRRLFLLLLTDTSSIINTMNKFIPMK